MDPKRLVKTSKYLSRHLRHDPGRLGLALGAPLGRLLGYQPTFAPDLMLPSLAEAA